MAKLCALAQLVRLKECIQMTGLLEFRFGEKRILVPVRWHWHSRSASESRVSSAVLRTLSPRCACICTSSVSITWLRFATSGVILPGRVGNMLSLFHKSFPLRHYGYVLQKGFPRYPSSSGESISESDHDFLNIGPTIRLIPDQLNATHMTQTRFSLR